MGIWLSTVDGLWNIWCNLFMVPVISIPGHHVVEKIEFSSGCLRRCLRPEESGEGHLSRHSLFLLSRTHSFNQSYQTTIRALNLKRVWTHSGLVSAVCLKPRWNVESSCSPVLSSGLLLRVIWWQKIDLSGFFFLLVVSTQPFFPPHHPQHRKKYVCEHTHRSSLPVFQNRSPLAVDSCPVPNQPPFPPTTKQQVQSSGSTSEGCDTAGAETLLDKHTFYRHILHSIFLFDMQNECNNPFLLLFLFLQWM